MSRPQGATAHGHPQANEKPEAFGPSAEGSGSPAALVPAHSPTHTGSAFSNLFSLSTCAVEPLVET